MSFPPDAEGHAIILFDGVCNFCCSSVQFIIARDPGGHFLFASQQSETGQEPVSLRQPAADDGHLRRHSGLSHLHAQRSGLKVASKSRSPGRCALRSGWRQVPSAMLPTV